MVGTKKFIQERANTHVYSIVMVKTKESDIGNKEACTKFWPGGVAGEIVFCDLGVDKGE
jgi:hypothetical protein